MASRKNKNEIINLTPFIEKGKLINSEDYYKYSLELIDNLVKENEDKEKIYTLFGIFLSNNITSISFEYTHINTKKEVIFDLIGTLSHYFDSNYQDITSLIKSLTLYFSY